MIISSFIKKVHWYHNKHGWLKLFKLAALKGWDSINKKEFIYALDLNTLTIDNTLKQHGVTVDGYNKESDIPANDMEQLIQLKSREILSEFLESFFYRGATFWISKKDGSIVNVIWTLTGGFNGFHMGMPICPNETIFLSGETFPEFRGRNYLAIVMTLICEKLKLAGISRAYSSAHVNNKASQKAQSNIVKTVGAVRYFQLNNWHIAIWDKKYLMIDYK